MKVFIVIAMSLLTLTSYASDGGEILDGQDFEQRMSQEKGNLSKGISMPWQYSNTICQAQTRCRNGMIASCRTVGFAYSGVPARLRNSCTWAVYPGRGVRCQGYAQVRDMYGRFIWSYVDIPVSCY